VNADAGFASWDEVLPPNLDWLRTFFGEYRRRVGLPFACQLRIEQVRPELVDVMVAGGCDYVVIGVETGDEEYRKKVLNKPFTNERALEAFRLLHAAGIRTFCSFLLGLPFETPKMLAKSIRLAQAIEPSELSWKYYTPERGTVLFGLVEREGLVIDQYVDHPFGAHEAMIKMTHCTQRDLDKANQAFRLLRERGPRGTFEEDPGYPLELELRS
jgi:coproporphyrinogen III oxidase-like Fe-S oxidoreductase